MTWKAYKAEGIAGIPNSTIERTTVDFEAVLDDDQASVAPVPGLSFPVSASKCYEFLVGVRRGTSVLSGTLIVAADPVEGVEYSLSGVETSSTGVSFVAYMSAGSLVVGYTTDARGSSARASFIVRSLLP